MTREPRKMPQEHKEIDITLPLDFSKIGTEEDPCFGKGYSIKAEECKRCGDSQVCAIVTSQLLHKQIGKQEQISKFKDVEEAAFISKQNKRIARLLLGRAEKKKDTWLSFSSIIPKLRELFNLTELEDKSLRQRCIKAAQETNQLKINKENTKYKW